MPEGDTIRHAARRVAEALVRKEIVSIETPHPRHRHDRWPERLQDRGVRGVDAHGKHLFVRFDGGLAVHSHLGMVGSWSVYRRGQRWRRSPRRAWLVIRTPEQEVVEFDGPQLELMTDDRTRFDQQLAALGPDVLADEFDERGFLGRLRDDDQTRGVGDAVLDQRTVAGMGNIWKSESCFLAAVDPWRPLSALSDEEALRVVREARPPMRESSERGGRIESYRPRGPGRGGTWVYHRAGLPCRRCGERIEARGQGDDNRTTYWCPRCQR